LGSRKPVGLEQLPRFDPEGFSQPLNGGETDAWATLGLDVLQVAVRYPRQLRRKFLAPAPSQPRVAEVQAEGPYGVHPLNLASCRLLEHARYLAS